MPTKELAMPEWLTRKDITGGAWTVEEGQPIRGDAWTQLLGRRMRVPTGTDAASRVVRGHEMVHAKVSPGMLYSDGRYGPTTESIIVAEEYRVNWLLKERAGFDIDELTDGSEHRSGEIAAQNDDWNGAIRFLTAISNTKAATAYIRGVGKHNKKMADSLTAFQKELKKEFRKVAKRFSPSSTVPIRAFHEEEEYQFPGGFRTAIELAKFIDKFVLSDDEAEEQPIPEPEQIKPKTGKVGQFAQLIEKQLSKPRRVDGKIGRRRIATNIGYNPRRIDRMLTDPEMRVFDRRTKGKGGVVLIDQSGSMQFTENDLKQIVEAAPGCVIIGYSHHPGSTTEPNVWVIADRGHVAETIPQGGRGNGVDGPAVRFAARKQRTGEPFIWVCDGVVTDGAGDDIYDNLDEEAAALVVKHRIHMVADVAGAVKALKKAGQGERLPVQVSGRLNHTQAWRNRQV